MSLSLFIIVYIQVILILINWVDGVRYWLLSSISPQVDQTMCSWLIIVDLTRTNIWGSWVKLWKLHIHITSRSTNQCNNFSRQPIAIQNLAKRWLVNLTQPACFESFGLLVWHRSYRECCIHDFSVDFLGKCCRDKAQIWQRDRAASRSTTVNR